MSMLASFHVLLINAITGSPSVSVLRLVQQSDKTRQKTLPIESLKRQLVNELKICLMVTIQFAVLSSFDQDVAL